MDPIEDVSNKKKLGAIIGLIVIVAAIAVGAIAVGTHKNTANNTASTLPSATVIVTDTPTPTASSAATATASTQEYKDGTYSTTGSYSSPGGTESIGVSLTLTDDKVTAATVTSQATDPNGKEYQADFISGYKSLVIGKSLDSISLSHVSGSSLTSGGFNEAVAAIKAQAKA